MVKLGNKCASYLLDVNKKAIANKNSFNPTNVTFKYNKLSLDTYPKNAKRNRYKTEFYLEQYTTAGECNEKPHYLTNELCNDKLCLLEKLNGATYFYGKEKFIVVSGGKTDEVDHLCPIQTDHL